MKMWNFFQLSRSIYVRGKFIKIFCKGLDTRESIKYKWKEGGVI